MEEKIKTLDEIQAGDEVVHDGGGGFSNKRKLVKVDRTTATQIIIGDERFNRDGGYLRGSTGYHRTRIFVPNAKAREEVLVEMKRDAVDTALFRLGSAKRTLSEEVCDLILQAYDLHRGKK